jgi:hypothetical protein
MKKNLSLSTPKRVGKIGPQSFTQERNNADAARNFSARNDRKKSLPMAIPAAGMQMPAAS